jgi:cytoskeletal protein RodZ
MSNDTHQDQTKENKTIISFKNSFWLVIILVFLFVGAINFIQAESGGEDSKGENKEKVEMTAPKQAAAEKTEQKTEQPKTEEAKPASAEAPTKNSGTKDPD